MTEYSEFVYRTIIDYQPEERESIVNLDHYGTIHERIVRCRDCRHYHATYNGCDEFGDIWHDEYATVEPDGFCAWAERKVGE